MLGTAMNDDRRNFIAGAVSLVAANVSDHAGDIGERGGRKAAQQGDGFASAHPSYGLMPNGFMSPAHRRVGTGRIFNLVRV